MRNSALAGHARRNRGNASASALDDLGNDELANIATAVAGMEHESDAEQAETECEDESLLVTRLEDDNDARPEEAED